MNKFRNFLLEIGTEELPASFLEPAAQFLKEKLEDFLTKNRIKFGKTRIFYTPRRIAVIVQNVAEQQRKETIEVAGPPWKVVFDPQGKPTKSAIGFAQSHGKTFHDLYPKKTERGEYAYLKKETSQEKTRTILANRLSEIIRSIPFPKTMRWTENKTRFGRPVRWLCVVFGITPIIFKLDGIVSSAQTFGHRNFAKKAIKIKTIPDYEKVLLRNGVLIDPVKRQREIEKRMTQLAKKIHGSIVRDEELLAEVVNIVELPFPILGEFKPEFLKLPAVVLRTALKAHQRCFSIQDQKGNLLPFFITVANNPKCNQKEVKTWYEKAIESRLKDAAFFLEEDLKIGISSLVEAEKKVTWIEGLGSLYEKTQRLMALTKFISPLVPKSETMIVLRAAELAKADLLTNMVREKEFTSLQGTMGGIYAEIAGEPISVAKAIEEHYAPKNVADSIPVSIEGSILSIADKLDNIVASFIVGTIPSGSEDPFALRRQATAILTIIMEKVFAIDLAALLLYSLSLFQRTADDSALLNKLNQFFQERLSSLFLDRKIRYDVTNAVLEVAWMNPVDAEQRAKALEQFRAGTDFEDLVIGQKRVANILKEQKITGQIQEQLLIEPEEKVLYDKAKELEPSLNSIIEQGDYAKALSLLLSLRQNIDELFDKVLIMSEDQNLRMNRFALLTYLKSLFLKVADLSKIVLEGE
jgi:glycyl-tRNA synthetase beta chain